MCNTVRREKSRPHTCDWSSAQIGKGVTLLFISCTKLLLTYFAFAHTPWLPTKRGQPIHFLPFLIPGNLCRPCARTPLTRSTLHMAPMTSFAGFALQVFIVKQHIPRIIHMAWCVIKHRRDLRRLRQEDQARSPRPHTPRSLKV